MNVVNDLTRVPTEPDRALLLLLPSRSLETPIVQTRTGTVPYRRPDEQAGTRQPDLGFGGRLADQETE